MHKNELVVVRRRVGLRDDAEVITIVQVESKGERTCAEVNETVTLQRLDLAFPLCSIAAQLHDIATYVMKIRHLESKRAYEHNAAAANGVSGELYRTVAVHLGLVLENIDHHVLRAKQCGVEVWGVGPLLAPIAERLL